MSSILPPLSLPDDTPPAPASKMNADVWQSVAECLPPSELGKLRQTASFLKKAVDDAIRYKSTKREAATLTISPEQARAYTARWVVAAAMKSKDLMEINGEYARAALDIGDGTNLLKITGLACLSLEKITLDNCFTMTSVEVLRSCPRLREANFADSSISDISALAGLPLEKLILTRCDEIPDFQALRSCTQLCELDLTGTWFSDITLLAHLVTLEKLTLSRCEEVTSIQALSNCIGLRKLDLSFTSISDIGPLITLARLTWLSVASCAKIVWVPLMRLKEVDISGTQLAIDGVVSGQSRVRVLIANNRGPLEANEVVALRGSTIEHLSIINTNPDQLYAFEPDLPLSSDSGYLRELTGMARLTTLRT